MSIDKKFKNKIILNYDSSELIETDCRTVLGSVKNYNPYDTSNYLTHSYSKLYENNEIVGKIYYYSNRIANRDGILNNNCYFNKFVIQLNNYKGFEKNTYVIGELFFETDELLIENDMVNKINNTTSAGTLFYEKVYVTIITNKTPIRTIIIEY